MSFKSAFTTNIAVADISSRMAGSEVSLNPQPLPPSPAIEVASVNDAATTQIIKNLGDDSSSRGGDSQKVFEIGGAGISVASALGPKFTSDPTFDNNHFGLQPIPAEVVDIAGGLGAGTQGELGSKLGALGGLGGLGQGFDGVGGLGSGRGDFSGLLGSLGVGGADDGIGGIGGFGSRDGGLGGLGALGSGDKDFAGLLGSLGLGGELGGGIFDGLGKMPGSSGSNGLGGQGGFDLGGLWGSGFDQPGEIHGINVRDAALGSLSGPTEIHAEGNYYKPDKGEQIWQWNENNKMEKVDKVEAKEGQHFDVSHEGSKVVDHYYVDDKGTAHKTEKGNLSTGEAKPQPAAEPAPSSNGKDVVDPHKKSPVGDDDRGGGDPAMQPREDGGTGGGFGRPNMLPGEDGGFGGDPTMQPLGDGGTSGGGNPLFFGGAELTSTFAAADGFRHDANASYADAGFHGQSSYELHSVDFSFAAHI